MGLWHDLQLPPSLCRRCTEARYKVIVISTCSIAMVTTTLVCYSISSWGRTKALERLSEKEQGSATSEEEAAVEVGAVSEESIS